MTAFTISNQCPLVLNFLIYLNNVYSNEFHDSTSEEKRFPLLYLNRSGLLDYARLQYNLKQIWNSYVLDFNRAANDYGNQSFVNWDVKYFQEHNHFSSLFEPTSEGAKRLQEVISSFTLWWWKQPYGGNYILSNVSDEFIPEMFEQIIRRSKESGVELVEQSFAVQIIYDHPPQDCLLSSKFFIIEEAGNFLQSHTRKDCAMRLFNLSIKK